MRPAGPLLALLAVMIGGTACAGNPRFEIDGERAMARVKHPAVHDLFAKEVKPQFLAGSLFRITGVGIRGVPEPRFAG
jgi:hypothetical protein